MYKKCLIIALLSCHISFSYENERDVMIKSYDNVRSYPMKVTYFNGQNRRYQQQQQQQPSYGKVLKVKSVSAQKNQKFKREYFDNVRGESKALPQSRQDIYSIKQLSYHGRDRPNAEALVAPQNNSTESNNSYESQAIQRSDSKPQKSNKKEYNSKGLNNIGDIPPYVPDDSPFYPLMKPSPINVMPTQPPSFDTVRNYVQYLKMRQRKFFSDFDDDNQEPAPEAKSSKQTAAPFEGEIDYFKEREVELAKEEQLRNQFSPANFKAVDVEQQPYTAEDSNASNEGEIISTNSHDGYRIDDDDNADISHRADNDDEHEHDTDKSEYHNYSDDADDSDDNGEDESRKSESFVPFRLYAQVRHVEADHHERPSKSNIKEKVTLAKKNIYYKEEGYEDKNYDHGAENIDYNLKEKKNSGKRKRTKRSIDSEIDVSQLPVALAYIKKSEIPQLTGEKLFKHLDELIRNSSVYLPDDDDDKAPIRFAPIKSSHYSTSEKDSSSSSAHKYFENLRNYPRESLYAQKNVKPCEEIPEDIDPVPADVEEKNSKFNESPKRLNNLGDKIKCFREKYFGKDPFSNPIFKEDEYVEAKIPIPVNHNLPRQANPLITVYDDVINNIRSGILREFKRKRDAEDAFKQASEQIAIKAKQVVIPNYSSVAGIAQLPIFDINTFLPKYRGAITKFSEEDDESSKETVGKAVTEAPKAKRKRNHSSLDKHQLDPPSNQLKISSAEKPKIKRNKNSRKKKANTQISQDPETPPPPKSKSQKSSNQKYKRYNAQNSYAHPTKHVKSYTQQLPPPNPNGKTTYRFKLL